MKKYRLIVNFYKFLGISWFVVPLFIFSYFVYKENSIIGGTFLSLFIYLIYFFVLGLIRYTDIIGNINIVSISKIRKKPKIVFHDELGYFSVYFFGREEEKSAYVEIYKQNLFTLSFVDKINVYDSKQIKRDIKNALDRRYSDRLYKIKCKEDRAKKILESKESDKVSKSYLDEWDGYLTTVGRRDEKIKSIINKNGN